MTEETVSALSVLISWWPSPSFAGTSSHPSSGSPCQPSPGPSLLVLSYVPCHGGASLLPCHSHGSVWPWTTPIHVLTQELEFSQAKPMNALGLGQTWDCRQYGCGHLSRRGNISAMRGWTVQSYMPLQPANAFVCTCVHAKKTKHDVLSNPGWNWCSSRETYHVNSSEGRKWRWTADSFNRLLLRNHFKQIPLFYHLTSALNKCGRCWLYSYCEITQYESGVPGNLFLFVAFHYFLQVEQQEQAKVYQISSIWVSVLVLAPVDLPASFHF